MTDTPSIPPALTPEEWAKRQASRSVVDDDGNELRHTRFGFTGVNPDALCIISAYSGSGATDDLRALHGVAAFALYGQPYGFTHEDVELLRKMYESYDLDLGLDGITAPVFEGIIAKIAALLPPK